MIDEARTSGAKVHFASLMDICHLKNAELVATHQKYKGRVVLRGDIVKDNSGSFGVFTELTVEQRVVVPVLQVVKEMVEVDQIIPLSVSSTETLFQ